MFSIFKNGKEVKNPFDVSIDKVYNRIKIGHNKKIIDIIRAEPDKKQRSILKMQLPSITFSGTFSHREEKSIIKHSGLIVLDFDHVKNVFEFKKEIIKDEFVHMAFISPSGDGLKVIVRIPDNISTHKKSAAALSDHFREFESYDHFDDVCRLCFESFDPEIYYNDKSKVFTKIVEIKKEIRVGFETDENEIFDRLKKWIETGDHYAEGNKHKFLVRFAAACNRFGLPQNFTEQRLYWTYRSFADVAEKDFIRIVKNIYRNHHASFATATFDKTEVINIKNNKTLQVEDLKETVSLDDVIMVEDIITEMKDSYLNGHRRGETTYFDEIDEHFTWRRGDLTLFHGIANHGKSTFLMNMVLLKSIKDDYKWAVFSPEQNPPTDFYNDLIHSYIGESTEPYHENQMSGTDYEIGIEFINEHFFYIYPEDKPATPKYINQKFKELVASKKVDGCIIDPFNQLDHDWMGKRDDKYLSVFLQNQKRFALDNNIFMVIRSCY